MPPEYEDFFLTVSGQPGAYTVSAQGPGAIHVLPVRCPYHETEEVRLTLEAIRQGFAPTRTTMRAVGELLFNALFPRRIIRAFESAPKSNGARLRLKLLIQPPELAHLPWELLFDPDEAHFVTHRLSHPIVRFVESDKPVAAHLASRPVRVLYVQANPPGTEPLDIAAGKRTVRQALGDDAVIHPLEAATPAMLRDALRQQPGFSILHYHGHGVFDEARDEGYLFLHDEGGGSHRLSGEMLASYLDGTPVRLVVLLGCETARDSSRRRLSGIAHKIMRSGSLPMVVAMQFAIYEAAANAFTGEFYKALSGDYPVDSAMVEGRKAVVQHLGGDPAEAPDWATPVLFMRSPDGRIFAEEQVEVPVRPVRTGVEELDWFVDRRKQLGAFQRMIEDDRTRRAMFIQAPERMGKSWLLVQLGETCAQRGIPFALVDFAETQATDYKSIIRELGSQLRPHFFRPVRKHLAATGRLDMAHSRGARQDVEARITGEFLGCLQNLARSERAVALLFDSFEQGTAPAQRWLVEYLLPYVLDRKSPQVISVLAGREVPPLADAQTDRIAWPGLVCFEERDVIEYFQLRDLGDQIPHLDVSRDCEGGSYLPEYVALQADEALASRMAEESWLYE